MAERANELLVPFDFDDREPLQQSLGGAKVLVPQRGPRRELVDLATQNARHLLEELKLATMEAEGRAGNPVYELGRELISRSCRARSSASTSPLRRGLIPLGLASGSRTAAPNVPRTANSRSRQWRGPTTSPRCVKWYRAI